MDSGDPKHYWSLFEVVLDSPCGWSSGKIVAESCPEGCPLTFGLSKVRTFSGFDQFRLTLTWSELNCQLQPMSLKPETPGST